MTNCTNNERDKQHRYAKELEKMYMDISDLMKSIEDLKAMMPQKMNTEMGGIFSTLSNQQDSKETLCGLSICGRNSLVVESSSLESLSEDEESNLEESLSEDEESNLGNHLILDDSEGDDDTRAFFPCPFCCVDIEVPMLCSHLQEEHCFDLKNAVCPLCAANLGKDVIGHFTMQHAHSLKRRRKSHKSGFWTNSSTSLGKELRELSSFLGSTSRNSRGNTHESAPDPLLSPFLCSIPLSDPEGNLQDKCSRNEFSVTSNMKSTEPSTPDEGHEQDREERRQRAEFVQQLMLSTIF